MDRRLDRGALAGLVAGLALGVVARNVPIRLALWLTPMPRRPRCGLEEAARCAVEGVPSVIGIAIAFSLRLVAVSAVMGVLAVVALASGFLFHRGGGRRPLVRRLLIGTGAALAVPVAWMLVLLAGYVMQ